MTRRITARLGDHTAEPSKKSTTAITPQNVITWTATDGLNPANIAGAELLAAARRTTTCRLS